jgi:SulP family sulfate permease
VNVELLADLHQRPIALHGGKRHHAGGRSPLSGMMHAGFLLLFMLVGARLASFIPLPALAAILLVVCWNMEKREFGLLLREWRTAAVLLTTFALAVFRDLTTGIVVGCVLAAALALLHRYLAGGSTDA